MISASRCASIFLLRLRKIMSLVKVICPKCGHTCGVDIDGKIFELCPICGHSVFTPVEGELPDLSMPSHFDNLEDFLRTGFRFLYFRCYDLLLELSQKMKIDYSDNYWTFIFQLIGDIKIDVIFALPELDYSLSEEEMKEDMEARYYHYARKKYHYIPQAQFSKISGHYADLPGITRGHWIKAKTKYEEKSEVIHKYCEIASKIKTEYLFELDSRVKTEDQRKITDNLKIWTQNVLKASSELYRYNQIAEQQVKTDFNKTPSPGNKFKFVVYLTLYILSMFVFVISMFDLIISIINGEGFSGTSAFLVAGGGTALYAIALVYYIVAGRLFKQRPILTSILVISSIFIMASGMITANSKAIVNWYFVVLITISIIVMVFAILKIIKYAPHNTSKHNTVIGDWNALVNKEIKFDFSFEWEENALDNLVEINYKEDWIYNY